jgi:hypothetical protein
MGVPEMDQLWLDLLTRSLQGELDKEERKFFKKLVKTTNRTSANSASSGSGIRLAWVE